VLEPGPGRDVTAFYGMQRETSEHDGTESFVLTGPARRTC